MDDAQQQEMLPPAGDIAQLAESLFRREAGKLVALMTRIFGVTRLQLAEDVVQEALVRALRTWPYYGVPRNPAAWIMQTAKHLAVDVIRRETIFNGKQPDIAAAMTPPQPDADVDEAPLFDSEIKDDRLRMMFACCHPAIPPESQAALALKTLCGFSTAEIAGAFLTSEAAAAKRLTRARQKLNELCIPFEIPSGEALAARLDAVLQTLYLLFNEGYKACRGENLIREELCHEATQLAMALAEHPVGNQPRTHALVALMLFNGARLPARVDDSGNILLLEEQDRSQWNRAMIQRGIVHLGLSAAGDALSVYHLQAGIAACHCTAANYAATDWPRILLLYDELVRIDPSPVALLNRSVAVAQVHGPRAGIAALQAIRKSRRLDAYYLLYAVLGEFEAQLNDCRAAAKHFRKALQQIQLKSEQLFLTKKLHQLETTCTLN
jgi:RNA polymerase sigma-70 factor (ECF subfamily)